MSSVTMSCALIGMMILSLALWLKSPLLFAVGLGVFGASFGSAEVAINVEGAAVEREMNKTVLPMMHGFIARHAGRRWCRMALTAFGVPATVHISLAALVGIAPIYIAIQAIPDGTGKMLPMAPSMAKKAFLLSRYPVAVDWCCSAGDGLCRRFCQRLVTLING